MQTITHQELWQWNSLFSEIFLNYSTFDIINDNLYDAALIKKIKFDVAGKENDLALLRKWQRAFRLAPDFDSGLVLINAGVFSALQITAQSRSGFGKTVDALFAGDETARKKTRNLIYNKALQVKDQTMHLLANAQNLTTLDSSNFTSNHVSTNVKTTFVSLPSYQDFFGDVDYCNCEQCKSILGHASYFVDLMRITQQAVIEVNNSILPANKLSERRPDLWKLKLSCEASNEEVPYLAIVNEVLSNTALKYIPEKPAPDKKDLWKEMAVAKYPFEAPYNLPLNQIRRQLPVFGTTLAEVMETFEPAGSTADAVSAELTGLSRELYDLLTVQSSDPVVLTERWGKTIASNTTGGLSSLSDMLLQSGMEREDFIAMLQQNLSEKELLSVRNYTYDTLVLPTLPALSTPVQVTIAIYENGIVEGSFGENGLLEGVVEQDDYVPGATTTLHLKVSGTWSMPTTDAPYNSGGFRFTIEYTGTYPTEIAAEWRLDDGTTNWNNVSAWNWTNGKSVFTTTISPISTVGNIAHNLLLNRGNAHPQFMHVYTERTTEGALTDKISNLTRAALDRILRFRKLSVASGLDYETIDWLISTWATTTFDINKDFILALGKIKKLAARFKTDPIQLSVCWYDIKTTGRGNGRNSKALFDRIFNTSALKRNGQDATAYHPLTRKTSPILAAYNNPTYASQPAVWFFTDADLDDDNTTHAFARSIMAGFNTSGDDLRLLADAFFAGQSSITLGVSNLSVFYRHLFLASKFKLTVREYLLFLDLTGKKKKIKVAGLDTYAFTLDDLAELADWADWLKQSGMTVYQLDYMVNGPNTKNAAYVSPGYDTAKTETLLTEVRAAVKKYSVTEKTFVSAITNSATAKIICDEYKAAGFVHSSGGIVLKTDTATESSLANVTLTSAQKAEAKKKLNDAYTNQQKMLKQKLAAFFKVDETKAQAIAAGVTVWSKISSLLVTFYLNDASHNETSQTFLSVFSRHLLLADSLKMGVKETGVKDLKLFYDYPQVTGGSAELPTLTLTVIRYAQQLKKLITDFDDKKNVLVAYLRDVQSTAISNTAALKVRLCDMDDWDLEQFTANCNSRLGTGKIPVTVAELLKIKQCFDLGKRTRLDQKLLRNLASLRLLSAAETANWKKFKTQTNELTASLKKIYSDADWEKIYDKYNGSIMEEQRDLLEIFCLWKLSGSNWSSSAFKTTRDLYEYLLIDVDTSGLKKTARVRQAIDTLQLYLQRCRIGLELNVAIDPDDIPDHWWTWLMSYEAWEMNKRVFIYPENYLSPVLLKNKTSLFKDFENSLSLDEVTQAATEEAFKKYLDSLQELSKLEYIDACRYTINDPVFGNTDTLYLIARTHTSPAKFYYRTRQPGDIWSEWLPIELSIQGKHVSPVYVFNRLHIFWVEHTVSEENATSSSSSDRYKIVSAAVKYSYLDFSGKWIQPQTLAENIIIDVKGPQNLYGKFSKEYFDTNNSCWHKVSALRIKNTAGKKSGGLGKEKLLISFGPVIAPQDELYFPDQNLTHPKIKAFQDNCIRAGQQSSQAFIDFSAFPTEEKTPLTAISNRLKTTHFTFIAPIIVDETYKRSWLNGEVEQIYFEPDLHTNNLMSSYGIGYDPSTGLAAAGILSNTLLHNLADGINSEPDFNSGSVPLLNEVEQGEGNFFAVQNMPGSFIFQHPSGTFLLEAEEAGYLQINTSVKSTVFENWQINQYSLVSAGNQIDESLSVSLRANIGDDNRPLNLIDYNQVFRDKLKTTTALEIRLQCAGTTMEQYEAMTIAEKNALIPSVAQAEWILRCLKTTGVFIRFSDTRSRALTDLKFKVTRLNTGVVHDLSQRLLEEGIPGLLRLNAQSAPLNLGYFWDQLAPSAAFANAPAPRYDNQVSFEGPYETYYRELFFHAPALVASLLNTNKQFEDAENWYKYIFNPTVQAPVLSAASFVNLNINSTDSGNYYTKLKSTTVKYIDSNSKTTEAGSLAGVQDILSKLNISPVDSIENLKRGYEVMNVLRNNYIDNALGHYWQYAPFRFRTTDSTISDLRNLQKLKIYNDSPFDPHAIASLRVGAYEKGIVMKYIDNLLDWGDMHFTRNTWEGNTTATMLYQFAYDLMGEKPISRGNCETTNEKTFTEIDAEYKTNIPELLTELENLVGSGELVNNTPDVTFNELELYFCVPDNAPFTAYWDRVEERLYKIRHNLDINGKRTVIPAHRILAGGVSVEKAGDSSDSDEVPDPNAINAIPHYRFNAMLARANTITSFVTQLGNALLSALEKKDAEVMARLNSTFQKEMLNLTTVIKNKTIEEQYSTLNSLTESLRSAKNREAFYTRMLDEGLLDAEQKALLGSLLALEFSTYAQVLRGSAVAGHLLPSIYGLADGGMNFGGALETGAAMYDGIGSALNQLAGILTTFAQYERRAQEWELQQKTAEFEVQQIDYQIEAANSQLAISQQDLEVHLKNIALAEATDKFLLSGKFTNQELYQWMIASLADLYSSAFKLAYDTARKAQNAYQFELDSDEDFIKNEYYDSLRKGLLAGERLQLALQQMEMSYLDNNQRRLEIEKTISLKQLFPAEFLKFKWGHNGGEQGKLNFILSQQLFDFDFPGHYCRKIKTVSVTIPAIVGPYQNLNATLIQNTNTLLLLDDSEAKDNNMLNAIKYLLDPNLAPVVPASANLWKDLVPNQQIAISSGNEETGLFQLDFNDERYLPFEGTGAVSSWELSLPTETNHIDFESISDVIIRIRYTALDGGKPLATKVKDMYRALLPESITPLAKLMDVKQYFADAWQKLFATAPVNDVQTLSITITDNAVKAAIRNSKLVSTMVQLSEASGAAINDRVPDSSPPAGFLSLKLGTKQPAPVKITGNLGVYTLQSTDTTTAADYTWQFRFNLADTPDALKTTVNSETKLDPEKFTNMAVLVVYKEPVFGV